MRDPGNEVVIAAAALVLLVYVDIVFQYLFDEDRKRNVCCNTCRNSSQFSGTHSYSIKRSHRLTSTSRYEECRKGN